MSFGNLVRLTEARVQIRNPINRRGRYIPVDTEENKNETISGELLGKQR